MKSFSHPKSVRRCILTLLYEQYQKDPMNMLSPEDFKERGGLSSEDLLASIHYLSDRGLVELMIGHHRPFFTSSRITANGIDVYENRFEFDMRFPPVLSELETSMAGLPHLIESLVEEAELSALDGEARRAVLRDIQYLRDEAARPAARWRTEVLAAVLGWIGGQFDEPEESLPSWGKLEAMIRERLGQ